MEKEKNRLSLLLWGTIGVVLLLCVVFALNIGDILNVRPPEFSKSNMLQALWYQYKGNYLEPGTLRALDKQRQNITTSEGQSYSMLRAVWVDDKATFDGVWQWTKDNLQRKEDHLVSWLFGEKPNGTYGVLVDQGGYNSASDADQDIALSLLFAWKRWNDQRYFGDAILMIRDIWSKEVVMIGGKPYLAADNIEKTAKKDAIIMNPSYLSPYTYKIFAEVDPSHDWNALAASSYGLIDASMRSTLDRSSTAFIPPDWISMSARTGEISAAPASANLDTKFSFDAMRVPWRLGLDYALTGDPRAKAVLAKMSFLGAEWNKKGSIVTSYAHDGTRLTQDDAPATYGGAMGYFSVIDPGAADKIFSEKLDSLFDPNESKWLSPKSYYDENWAWFGMALYAGELQDLFKGGAKPASVKSS